MSNAIQAVVVAGALALCIRLFHLGLHRRYRALFLFLIFTALQNAIPIVFTPNGMAYVKIWTLTQPVEWFLNAWVVLELYSLVLEDYKGLYTVGRWLLMVAIGIALLASGLSLLAPYRITAQGRLMAYYYVAERAIYFSLVVFVMTILILLARYPISLSRNLIVHSVVFSLYFLAITAFFLLLSTRGFYMVRIAGYGIQATNLAALGSWLALLNTTGEKRLRKLRPEWMPGREDWLLDQLNSLNVALLQVARVA
jgi:hypothetical protein